MEIILDYDALCRLEGIYGFDSIIEFLRTLHPGLDLYQISDGWTESREYVLKCKGSNGDLIVNWA